MFEELRYRSIVGIAKILSEKQFFCLKSLVINHQLPELKNPKTYNDKLRWIMIHVRDDLYHVLVDKYAVRNYVRDKAGETYLNNLMGVWEKAEDIDFGSLPNKFVLKTSHGSGWNILCRDKGQLDVNKSIGRLKQWMGRDYYDHSKEWAYKGVRPRILCEAYIEDPNHDTPNDYKIHCFNGRPRFIQVDFDRYEDHTRNYYDVEWHLMPMTRSHRNHPENLDKPVNFDEMLSVAMKLSENLLYARVDLYNVSGKILFGEITLYPGSATEKYSPEHYNLLLGEWLDLGNH